MPPQVEKALKLDQLGRFWYLTKGIRLSTLQAEPEWELDSKYETPEEQDVVFENSLALLCNSKVEAVPLDCTGVGQNHI